ncbi:Galactokinase [Microthyrium microscopicum]|uniref:Galactokinase n=1 Tax=Microthyrium microscopicum TaxID=703497 RepID=A0A6A6TWS0_9PEZI|nr:Galactokinase [Microthyrium microscopicum]
MEVPTATSLKDIYPEDAITTQTKRWQSLLTKFQQVYNRPAEFVARSPGRVNIIGEHIDYSLYEVLPMAITADVLMAVAIVPDKSHFTITNTQDRFPAREFDVPDDGKVEIDASSLEWSNYFKAGLSGASELLKKKGKTGPLAGMQVLVDGTVPAGGGLSSSAAFTCSSALAAMVANGQSSIDKTELCELAITSERAVGVNSGGMDQSASVFSIAGAATYVSFLPSLTATPVKFPDTGTELVFVIAQSFVAADKHTSGPVCYNLRVVECTLAAAVLAKIFALKKGLAKDASPLGTSLRGFHDAYAEQKEGVEDNKKTSIVEFQAQLATLVTLVEDYLPQEEGYTREQIGFILDLSVDELNDKYMSKFPVRTETFKLRQRALHVFNEAGRVLKFRKLLSDPPSDGDLLKELGTLMNDTQDSCRDIYECSCPELDELCQLARSAGSYGSRLTGAGWGGCSVHLVPKEKVEGVKKAWIDKYYRKKFPDMDDAKLEEAIVVSKPGSGSFLFKVTGEPIG